MGNSRKFNDRAEAGSALAGAFAQLPLHHPLVLGLPRGGAVVACEVASGLDAELDVLVVRKLRVPYEPELAFGAVASGGIRVLNDDVLRLRPELDEAAIERIAAAEADELARRETVFRGDRPYPVFEDRDVVLVDDGLATGATMAAAVRAARQHKPRRVIAALPVGSVPAVKRISAEADDVLCLDTPLFFGSVGSYYERFDQIADDEVRRLLEEAWSDTASSQRRTARAHLDDKLDGALDETFPASDPIELSTPTE